MSRLKLIAVELGRFGAIRRYHDDKHGLVETVTTWRSPGAHVIRFETDRSRELHREKVRTVLAGVKKQRRAQAS